MKKKLKVGEKYAHKISLDEERLKLQKNKENKIKEGKKMKEANRLMRENLLILKNNLNEHAIEN